MSQSEGSKILKELDKQFEKNLTDVLVEFSEQVLAKAKDNLISNKSYERYRLIKKLQYEIVKSNNDITINYGSDAKNGSWYYGMSVERGVGARKYKPSFNDIQRWYIKKIALGHISPDNLPTKLKDRKEYIDRAVTRIIKKIFNKGIEAKPFLEPAMQDKFNELTNKITEAANVDK